MKKDILIYISSNKNKKRGPTEIRTRINGFKVQCANRYTIGPINILQIYYSYKFKCRSKG